MMKIKGTLKLSAAPVALGLALMAAPAFAQTLPATGAPAEDAPKDIIVTGSRIASPNLSSAAPVTVISVQDIKLQGTTRIEDVLNSLPQVFASQASTVSNGATGTATVNLRGIGAKRTLVLINGRRLLPGDPFDSAADLNAIPEALIKRVDVLTGGAASTYGADAVAGVVNFVMDNEFTGVRLDSQYNLYNHDNTNPTTPSILNARQNAGFTGYGYPKGNVADGGGVNTTLTLGAGFDDNHGHITAYFGYRQVNAVTQNNRDYSACTIQNASATALQCGGSSTSTPGNAIVFHSGTSTFYQIGANRTLNPGRTRYNFAPTNYFQRPDERYTGGFFAHYDVSDAIRPYAEFMFMDDRSVAQIAPSGDFGNTLTINCDNPLLSAQAKTIACSNENLITGFLGAYPLTRQNNPGAPINFIDPTTGQTYNKGFFQLLRRNVEGGPRRDDLEHTEYRGLVGMKGDLGKAWSYDAYYQYGRTLYAETYTNDVSVARLTKSLDVVTGPTGAPICRSVRDGTDPSCVPYDIFGQNVTQAAINYLSTPGFQRGIVSEQVASGSFTGKLGQYGVKSPWADDGISVNIGAEYRKEKLELNVDQEFATGDLSGQGGPVLPISGSYNVTEFFGEAQVPVVRGGIFDDLTLTGGYRYSKYRISNGRSFSTDTYKFGVEFAPIRDIRFRASYNRAVRAPNLQELFSVQHVALDGTTDPCAGRVITAADVGCIATGLRVGQRTPANPAGQYNGLIGGTSTLNPERATTKTIGIVLQPRYVRGLAVTVDYYDIKVTNAIQGFGADAIITTCVASQNPVACNLIHRNPVSGSLWLTNDGYITDIAANVGGIATKGIDVNATYTKAVGHLGTASLNLVGTYLDKFTTDNGLAPTYECAGYYGVTCGVPAPKWRSKLRAGFNFQNGIGISAQWRYFGPVKVDYSSTDSALAGTFFAFGSRIPSQSYFDLAATFSIGKNYTFRLGANNILDRDPPLVTSGAADGSSSACPTGFCNGNTYPAVYDALGRYMYASISLKF